MAMILSLFALLLLAAGNSDALLAPTPGVTVKPIPGVTLSPKPAVDVSAQPPVKLPSSGLPPMPAVPGTVTVAPLEPAVTLPPKPAEGLPPKLSAALPTKRTLPPKPDVALPPIPSVTMPPKPAVTLPPLTTSGKLSVTLLPKPVPVLSPKPVTECEALVKVLLHNTATRAIVIKVAELGPKAKNVITQVGNWSLVGTVTVTAHNDQVLHLMVTVSNDRGEAVTKTLVLELLKRFNTDLQGTKFVVLKAVEDTAKGANGEKQKLLHLWTDAQIVLTINLSA